MNSVKITYIICSCVFELMMVAIIFLAPTYLTPGWYWWSVFATALLVASGQGFSERLNSWEGMGEVKNGNS